MSAAELDECLAVLHWSGRALAAEVELDPKQIARWVAGARIPADIAAWLRALADFHRAHPSPRK